MFIKNRFRKLNKEGSLLLEALLATVILSVSIVLIIQSMTASLRAARFSSRYTVSLLLLENKMFELLTDGGIDSGVRIENNPHPKERDFAYSVFTSQFDSLHDSIEGTKFNEVDLKISWKTRNNYKNVGLTTLMFDLE